MTSTSSKGKWIVFGVKAALTALAILPQLRKTSPEPGLEPRKEPETNLTEPQGHPLDFGVYGLLFLNQRGEAISSYRFERNILINRSEINREEIIRVAREAEAFAAVITFDRNIFNREHDVYARRVIPQIADALSDAGVRVFQRAFMSKDNPTGST